MTEVKKLTIVMASPEAVPFAKTGGLGDVVGALPTALARRGHDTDIWIPFHLEAAQWYRRRVQWPRPGLLASTWHKCARPVPVSSASFTCVSPRL